jgi:hypothetical protein
MGSYVKVQTKKQCARSAHQNQKTKKRVGSCPHSTFSYEAAVEFRFTLPSSATE